MLSWLNTFDMGAHLLRQLTGIKHSLQYPLHTGVFSGGLLHSGRRARLVSGCSLPPPPCLPSSLCKTLLPCSAQVRVMCTQRMDAVP